LLKPQRLFWPAAAWKLTFLYFRFWPQAAKNESKRRFSALPEAIPASPRGDRPAGGEETL
jgi:hypothetical protein